MQRLEDFEKWREPRKVDCASAAGQELWEKDWADHGQMLTLMRECEATAAEIRNAVQKDLDRNDLGDSTGTEEES